MKRLTKDERIGATAIALVALLICGGSFLWNRRERGTPQSEIVVKSIILASDSLEARKEPVKEEKDTLSEYDGKRGRQREVKKSSSDNSRKRKKVKESDIKRKKDSSPPRDFLSDPI